MTVMDHELIDICLTQSAISTLDYSNLSIQTNYVQQVSTQDCPIPADSSYLAVASLTSVARVKCADGISDQK